MGASDAVATLICHRENCDGRSEVDLNQKMTKFPRCPKVQLNGKKCDGFMDVALRCPDHPLSISHPPSIMVDSYLTPQAKEKFLCKIKFCNQEMKPFRSNERHLEM